MNRATLQAAGIRALRTFAQAFVAALLVTGVPDTSTHGLLSAAIAGAAAVVSFAQNSVAPATPEQASPPTS